MLPERLSYAKVSEHILQRLGEMTDRRELCDTRVRVKDKDFHCHRLILAAISQYFEDFFKKNSDKNSWDIIVDDEDVSPQSFAFLHEYIYRRQTQLHHSTPLDIFKCFAFFRFDFILKDFDKFFFKCFQPKDWVLVWLVAQKYKIIDVVETSSMMAAEHIDEIPEKTFLSLHKSMVLILLSMQKKLTNDGICKKIISWVMSDLAERLCFLNQLLPLIDFDQLDPNYLIYLLEFPHQEIKDIISDNFQDATVLLLKRRFTDSPLLFSALVAVMRENVSFTHGPVLKALNDQQYSLAPAPEKTGDDFATCKYKNDICLSGGSYRPQMFIIYNSGANHWYPHLDLPGEGKEKHAMIAINNQIYVLGGLTRTSRGSKETSSEVLMYNIRSTKKLWTNVCHLPEAVRETSVAALGHRIYVFGGLNAQGVETNLVQCVDTVNNVAYVAGRLPFGAYRSRALSNNGVVFVILLSGEVLRMWEDFHLAEERENYFAAAKDKSAAQACKEEFVAFKEVTTVSASDHLSAYITRDEIVVVDKSVMPTINISTGQIQKRTKPFTEDAHCFDLYEINILKKRFQKEKQLLEIANFSKESSLCSTIETASPRSYDDKLTSECKKMEDASRGGQTHWKTQGSLAVAAISKQVSNPKRLERPMAAVEPRTKVTDDIPAVTKFSKLLQENCDEDEVEPEDTHTAKTV